MCTSIDCKALTGTVQVLPFLITIPIMLSFNSQELNKHWQYISASLFASLHMCQHDIIRCHYSTKLVQ